MASPTEGPARGQMVSAPKKIERSASLTGADAGALLRAAQVVFPWIQSLPSNVDFRLPNGWNHLKRIENADIRKKAEDFMRDADKDILMSCFAFNTKANAEDMSKARLLAWLFSTWLSSGERLVEHEFVDREERESFLLEPLTKKAKPAPTKSDDRPAQTKKAEVASKKEPSSLPPDPNVQAPAMPLAGQPLTCTWTGEKGDEVCPGTKKAACDVGFCWKHCGNAKTNPEHKGCFSSKSSNHL